MIKSKLKVKNAKEPLIMEKAVTHEKLIGRNTFHFSENDFRDF